MSGLLVRRLIWGFDEDRWSDREFNGGHGTQGLVVSDGGGDYHRTDDASPGGDLE